MKKLASSEPQAARDAIDSLFEEWPPILVEARFPGASPDWYLFERREQLDELLSRLGPAVELHVNSVWDLSNEKKSEVVAMRDDLTKQIGE